MTFIRNGVEIEDPRLAYLRERERHARLMTKLTFTITAFALAAIPAAALISRGLGPAHEFARPDQKQPAGRG